MLQLGRLWPGPLKNSKATGKNSLLLTFVSNKKARAFVPGKFFSAQSDVYEQGLSLHLLFVMIFALIDLQKLHLGSNDSQGQTL